MDCKHTFKMLTLISNYIIELTTNVMLLNTSILVSSSGCSCYTHVQEKEIEVCSFSEPDWYVEPDQNCTLPLVKNGKIGNTNCLIGNRNILGYMHVVSIRTPFVPSKMVIHQCILKL